MHRKRAGTLPWRHARHVRRAVPWPLVVPPKVAPSLGTTDMSLSDLEIKWVHGYLGVVGDLYRTLPIACRSTATDNFPTRPRVARNSRVGAGQRPAKVALT